MSVKGAGGRQVTAVLRVDAATGKLTLVEDQQTVAPFDMLEASS